MSRALVRAIRRAKDAIRPHDPVAHVIATASVPAANALAWTIETESAALARKGRKTALICGIANTPTRAAALFVEGLGRVVAERAGERERRRS